MLRRPARRRQDLAGPVASPGPWAASSSASAWAACTTRPRSAATAAPMSARLPGNIIQAIRKAGVKQPRDDAGRDRQAGRGLPRRPVGGPAGGARSGAELDLPRPLPGRAVRPLRSAVHRHRQRAGHHPRPAARPDGDHRAPRLHRRREAADRPALPGAPAARGQRARRRSRSRSPTTALHAIIGDYTREAGVRSLEREIGAVLRNARGAVRRGHGRARSRSTRTTCAPILGPPRFESEVADAHRVPGVATGLAWTPVGGDILFIEATRMPGKRPADPDRPARRRDEGERPGGAQPGQVARAAPRHRRRRCSSKSDIHVHVPAGAMPKDGPVGRRGDVHGAGLAADRPHGPQRHGDDRRDHPARPGAAGRRHQGEGGRRAARRGSTA